jgi:hypothetical protein
MELDLVATLRSPPFEHSQAKAGERANRAGLLCVFDDLCAGVVFPFHDYSIPQNGRKARDFFAILESFFVDGYPPLFENIQTLVLFFVAGGVKFQSPELLF